MSDDQPEIRPALDAPEPEPPAPSEVKILEKPKKERLLGLDAFRGLTIILMLIVNNIALDDGTAPLLEHAPWKAGIRLADLVFPWFLFCVGVAIPFSIASYKKKGLPSWVYDLRAIGRTLALLALGCLIASLTDKKPVFRLDVLQLIGLAYLVGAFLGELPVVRRLIIAGLMLLAYGLAIQYIPVPGVGAPVFEESRNLIKHVNDTFLRQFGLAGFFSMVPAGAMVLIGSAFGDVLRLKDWPYWRRMLVLGLGGLILVCIGMAWDKVLPYNKPVWTPSYITLTAGLGAWMLLAFTAVVDWKGWRWPVYPLLVYGSNAILAYVVPIVVKLTVLQTTKVGGTTLQKAFSGFFKGMWGPIGGAWGYTIAYIFVWWLVWWYFYWRKWFVRV